MSSAALWSFGPFQLDTASGCLWRDNELIALPPKPVAVLACLVAQAGEVVTKEILLDTVWPETAISEGVLKTYIGQLRRVLGETAREPKFIETIPRRGYRFMASVTRVDASASRVTTEPAEPAEQRAKPSLNRSSGLDAERRQLTVLCCDVLNSSQLAGHLDPEALRDVLQAYYRFCTEIIEPYGGYIAPYLGEGLLAYFGYPTAHEDDAQRAIWSSLSLLDRLDTLNAQLDLPVGYQLSLRIALHTGPVVIDAGHPQTYQGAVAIGETLHIATRLQNLARPNSVIISASTRRLIGGVFHLKDLGEHPLHGMLTPIRTYQVEAAKSVESRFEAMQPTTLLPLIGRDAELELLHHRWEQATEGEGQVVLLSGEAGLGKSRLVQALWERLGDLPHRRVLCQCSPYHTHSAYYPIISYLRRTMKLDQLPDPADQLKRLETLFARANHPVNEMVALIAPLLSIPFNPHDVPMTLSPERQKEQTMAAWADLLVGWSQHEPVWFILEDAHWCDPTTLEALAYVIDRAQAARVLLVLTFRPEFTPPWNNFGHITSYALNRLTRRQSTLMAEQIADQRTLHASLIEQIVTKSDGIPLFVEELTKTALESVHPTDQPPPPTVADLAQPISLPMTLHETLMARLDHLPESREIAQFSAVLGREFTYDMLQAILPLDDEALQHGLTQLVQADLLHQRGRPPRSQYLFKHALVQDAAYQSMLRRTRHHIHRQIAHMLETRYPSIVETQPELLAHHYSEAGLSQLAITYWKRASSRAVQQYANAEAIAHINKGLALLPQLPDTLDRTQDELTLLTDLGVALTMTQGFAAAEVEQTYARAYALCQQLGDSPERFPILYGLWNYYTVRADFPTVSTLVERIRTLAQSANQSVMLMQSHLVQGQTSFIKGHFPVARTQIEQALDLYDPAKHLGLAVEYGEDPGIAGLIFAAMTLWQLGYPDLALQHVASMIELAEERAEPFSKAQTLFFGGLVHLFRKDYIVVKQWAERLMSLSHEQDFMLWIAGSHILLGWALSYEGQYVVGLEQLQQGLNQWQATGAAILFPWYLGLQALPHWQSGQPDVALSLLTEALEVTTQRGEHWCEAELYRLRAELLLSEFPERLSEAEHHFQVALDIARTQNAKSWELRIATSLARLQQQQGKPQAARTLLMPVYNGFTEGFETVDLQEANALLMRLAH